MTMDIMKRLHYDNKTIAYTMALIANHSKKLHNKTDIKKMMCRIGDELFFELMEMKKCDNSAKNEFVLEENIFFDKLKDIGREIIANDECRSIKGLAVTGSELVQLGLKGAEIGGLQHEMLELVMEEKLPNNREELLKFAEQRCRK